jgi:hypothetical protein
MIIPVQFGLNCPCGFREEEKVWVFYADPKSKMVATAGH